MTKEYLGELRPQVAKLCDGDADAVMEMLSLLPRATLCAAVTNAGLLRAYIREAKLALGRPEQQPKRKAPRKTNEEDAAVDDLLRAYIECAPVRMGKHFRKTRVAPPNSTAPLHAPPVDRMHMYKLTQINARVAKALGYATEVDLLQAAIGSDRDVFAGRVSTVAYSDILTLLTRGYIVRCRAQDVRRTAFAFSVLEEKIDENDKTFERRRFIIWPRQLNAELKAAGYTTDMGMTDAVGHCVDVHAGERALVFDLKLGFNQVPLGEGMGPYFGFAVKNPAGEVEHFFPTVLPMGASPSPEVLQHIVEGLAGEAVRRSNVGDVRWRVQIDGVRFIGRDSQLQQVRVAFVEVCREVNATIKPEPALNVPHAVGEWYGVTFDYTRKVVSLPSRALGKLADALRLLDGDTITVENLLAMFGLLQHYGAIMGAPVHEFFAAVKLFRRVSAALARGEKKRTDAVVIWRSALDTLKAWISFVATPHREVMPPKTLDTQSRAPAILFTDASKTGWGAVLCIEGTVRHVGGRWDQDQDLSNINMLEALAVERGAAHFAEQLSGSDVVLVVDNTATHYALKRGSARSGALNAALGTALRRLKKIGPRAIVVAYIASGANPADGPSRGNVFLWSSLRENIRTFLTKTFDGKRGITCAGAETGKGVKSGCAA